MGPKQTRLYKRCLRLMCSVCHKFDNTVGFDEAFATANLVFLQACVDYDKLRCAKFKTFLYSRLQGVLLNMRRKIVRLKEAQKGLLQKKERQEVFDVHRVRQELSDFARFVVDSVIRPDTLTNEVMDETKRNPRKLVKTLLEKKKGITCTMEMAKSIVIEVQQSLTEEHKRGEKERRARCSW